MYAARTGHYSGTPKTRKMLEHWSGGASMKEKRKGKQMRQKKKGVKKKKKFQCGNRTRDLFNLQTLKKCCYSITAHAHLWSNFTYLYIYIREENNSRPSAKNRPKGWNGRLFTQLTGHQADQSQRDKYRAVTCLFWSDLCNQSWACAIM